MSNQSGFASDPPSQALYTARQLARDGRLAEAERAFKDLLSAQPETTEALRFLAKASMSRGDAAAAIEYLNRAATIDRADIGVLMELGVAYRVADRFDASRYVLERALELGKGHNATVRILLANVLELDERPELALTHYFRAILDAQQGGQWLDDDTTPPGIRALVQHAMQYVFDGRHSMFHGVLQPFRVRVPPSEFDRIDRALAIYLLDSDERPVNAHQKPTVLYVPDLDASPSLELSRFDWLTSCVARIETANPEIEACLAVLQNRFDGPLFGSENVRNKENAESDNLLPRVRRNAIYNRGTELEAVRKLAPQLIAALNDTPLARIPQHSPEVEIIVLQPAAHASIFPGRSNSRCKTIVALPGNGPVSITTGGESHALREGEALVIDSSFGIEYSNAGESEARLLTFEIWHPSLTVIEREALTALMIAIVDFDTRLEQV